MTAYDTLSSVATRQLDRIRGLEAELAAFKRMANRTLAAVTKFGSRGSIAYPESIEALDALMSDRDFWKKLADGHADTLGELRAELAAAANSAAHCCVKTRGGEYWPVQGERDDVRECEG